MSTPDWQRQLDEAAANDYPPAVVRAWLDAGARPGWHGMHEAAKRGNAMLPELLDAFNPDHRAGFARLLTPAVLDNDRLLAAVLAKTKPDELNHQETPESWPAWFAAFRQAPDHDDRLKDDPARVARFPAVLGKLQAAGADLETVKNDPVYGLNGKAEGHHAEALRTLLRVAHERRELRAAADEATHQAPPAGLPSLDGLAGRLDARAGDASARPDQPEPAAPVARRRL